MIPSNPDRGKCWLPALALGLVFCLAGCGSTPDQFYRLSADGNLPSAAAADSLVLGIGPVSVPDYIDRDELVFQSAPNRFEVPPEHRWAGALDKSVADVLAVNLGHRLGTSAVLAYPWGATRQPRYAIPITIRQFHAQSGGDAILDVSWEIREGEGDKTLRRGSQVFTEALAEEGYDGVVSAESRLLGKLADAIAKMIP